MSIGIYIFFVGVLVSLCFAATPQTILYNGLAVTLVPPRTSTSNPTLVLAPLNINDPNQQWYLPNSSSPVIASANPDFANIVWDVNANSKDNGTKVILFPKKPGNDLNQDWTISNGVITSQAAAGFTVAPNGTSNLYMTYDTPPAQATFQNPITQPWHCSSVGDPHITPYPNGRNDLYSPGSQQPGTYTLSKTGVEGDPNYLIIQADQQLCRPNVPNVYCNKRGIVKTLGHVIEVAGDKVTIDGVVTSVTGTIQVGNGVNVTKLGTNNYVVSYPNGQVQFQTISYYGEFYITATHGPIPTGGVCTPILGPNYNNTSGQKVSPYNFCLSWRARNISEDLFNYSDYLSWRAANPLNFTTTDGNFTTNNKTLQDAANAACAPLAANSSLAQQCAALVPTAPIAFVYQACLDDVIALNDPAFGPSATDAYSKRCSANAGASGITIVLSTSGANSIASGPGIASNISLSLTATISFNITARDVNGVVVTTGGDNFVVTSTGGFSFNITYLGNGIYQVTYTPNVAGTFNISVTLNGITAILNSPFTVTISVQGITKPLHCSSIGDPHITPYPIGRNDLYNPGSQQPGTYTLSRTGVEGDSYYLLIQADQQLCPGSSSVYCNRRAAIKTVGHVIIVAGDNVTIDGVLTSVTGTLQVEFGLNVTKLGKSNYLVTHVNGVVQFQTISFYGQFSINATKGPFPTGGVCTAILGPNYNNTSGQKISAYNFCLSWRARNIGEDLFNYSDELAWKAANPQNFTTSDGNLTTTNQTLLDACAPLAPNSPLAQQCAAQVPNAPIADVYQACLNDVIATQVLSFATSAIDEYSKICSANAAGSGITIVLPTSGVNCIAAGPGLSSNISLSLTTTISFNITARDVNGVIVTTGGDNFVVTSTGSFAFNITYIGSGVYQVTYIPNVAGTYTISISLNGIVDIQGSPFTITIYVPVITQPLHCSSVGDPHVTPYSTGRTDLYSPGSQQPGTYTLSRTGVKSDPDYLLIQADQQLCKPTVPQVYCNQRGAIATLGHVIVVAGNVVTIDGVVTSVTGTLQVAFGLNVTKLGTSNYVVTYFNGQVQFQTISYYGEFYITASHGPIPTGGVCTPFLGPNYNNTSGQKVSPYNFCLSWRARDISEDLFNYSSYLAWRNANPLNFPTINGTVPTTNQTLLDAARDACAAVAPTSPLAQQCAALVPTAPIADVYQACQDDCAYLQDLSFGASAADAYGKICSANAAGRGITIILPTSGANSIAAGPGLASSIGLSFTTSISFNITARDVTGKIVTTGGDNFVVTSTGSFSFNITYLGLGIYQVTYTPNVIGTFNISVSLNGIALLNSPFTVTIDLQVTVPSKSTAFGPGLTTVPLSSSFPFNTASFTVVARTASGAQRTSGGDRLFINLSAGINPHYTDNNDGTYTVTYSTPTGPIPFTFNVFVSIVGPGQQIAGSPFQVKAV